MVEYRIDNAVTESPQDMNTGGIYGVLHSLLKCKKVYVGEYKGKKGRDLLEEMCYGKKTLAQRLVIKDSLLALGCDQKSLDALILNCKNDVFFVRGNDWGCPIDYIDTTARNMAESRNKLRKGKSNLEKSFGIKISLKDAYPAVLVTS